MLLYFLLESNNIESIPNNNVLIIICSKSPNPNVYNCVKYIYMITKLIKI